MKRIRCPVCGHAPLDAEELNQIVEESEQIVAESDMETEKILKDIRKTIHLLKQSI
jgi:uncharacterized Zn finger protein (UPF0148 family)